MKDRSLNKKNEINWKENKKPSEKSRRLKHYDKKIFKGYSHISTIPILSLPLYFYEWFFFLPAYQA